MYNLDERLSLCASFVREGARVADIGTDHGYLPVSLVLSGRCPSAVAADIRKGPLENAKAAVLRAGVQDKVKTVLCDGLDGISPDETDDIVIAGMGGELIARLIDRAPWLRDSSKHLILQPMTKSEKLRRYLCDNGFITEAERACSCGGKSYCVMLCRFCGETYNCSEIFAYAGLLENDFSSEAMRYKNTIAEKLRKKLRGLSENDSEKALTEELIASLECQQKH